ncbi:hypothetical protein C6501_00455 [Candidatus Poribacteria bacterium]|nr:MAG: hypothetical protein C6501_00455 [Candidatus Poribacteria bacterium]
MKRFNFFLASILIFAVMLLVGSAIAATVSYTLNAIPTLGPVWWTNTLEDDPAWGDKFERCMAVVTADILDDDGNVACHFSLRIERSYKGKHVWKNENELKHAVRYSGAASAWACGNWEGKGNAVVNMPGKEPAHDGKKDGAIDIGGDGEPDGVYASDSSIRDGFRLDREAKVTASCFHGGISAQVGIQISGF